MAVMFEYKFAT